MILIIFRSPIFCNFFIFVYFLFLCFSIFFFLLFCRPCALLSIWLLFDLLDFVKLSLALSDSLSLSPSSSGEKFQSLSNQIRTVHWINLCKHCLLCLIFLSIYKNPLYPPSLIWLSSYWSIIIWFICSLFNYSFTLYIFTKKKMISIRCLIGHVGFFFQCFPFYFRFIWMKLGNIC